MPDSLPPLDARDVPALMQGLGERARAAAADLAVADAAAKSAALQAAARHLRARQDDLIAANGKDMAFGREKGLSAAMLDRLELTPARIAAMADAVETIADQPDPVGAVLAEWTQPNGLKISRVRVPIGVIGVIYESRPNVTADAGALAVKSGNAAILRGGSESLHSSGLIAECMAAGLAEAGLPEAAVQLVPTRDRAAVGEMLSGRGVVDLVIPRGGKTLIARVQDEARVPVLAHLDGMNTVYLDASADTDIAVAVTLNSKMRRVGVCGAAETLLIDKKAADRLLPPVIEALVGAGCELRGDAETMARDSRVTPAAAEDWDTEYLAPILTVGLVDGVEAAIDHIARHGSHHTDCIVAEDAEAVALFLNRVDSAILMHNASTQFADGGEFGMGAEIGIATGKLHARGPVGADKLTTYKYHVHGHGQVRP